MGPIEDGSLMEFLGRVVQWFADPANWSGPGGVPARLFEHVEISALSIVIGSLIALPLALYIGHTRRFELIVVSAANMGRAIPTVAIIGITLPITIRLGLGLGFWPTIIAMVVLAVPPILTNVYVGIHGVDEDTLEASRGMGMTGWQVLRRVEIPLATPLIVTGLRLGTVQVVANATFAALVGWGGLGRFIIDGFAVRDEVQVFAGGVLVATLALVTDLAFGRLERAVGPTTTSPPAGFEDAGQVPRRGGEAGF